MKFIVFVIIAFYIAGRISFHVDTTQEVVSIKIGEREFNFEVAQSEDEELERVEEENAFDNQIVK